MGVRERAIAFSFSLSFFLLLPNTGTAQIPTAPPGYDQGPRTPTDTRVPKKGHRLIKLTSTAVKKLKRKYKRKYGRVPSKRQLRKFIARQFGLRISKSLTSDGVVHATGRRGNEAKIKKAVKQGIAQTVEPNFEVFAFSNWSEKLYDDLFCFLTLCWGLDNFGGLTGAGMEDADVDAPDVWDTTEGEGVVIGVIDTGVYYNHYDLTGNIWENPNETLNGKDDDGNGFVDDIRGWDFINDDNDPDDDNLHGTHVAGIIAAIRGNSHGIIGVAPKAKILPLKILSGEGRGDTAGLIAAIDYAIKLKEQGVPIKVLNASLGGGDSTDLERDSLSRANKAGILFVAAAGNNGTNNDETPVYPSSYGTELRNVISVASIDESGEKSGFSNFGPTSVHVAAPGGNVWSPIFFQLYLPSSGTSMAAPYVAGVAALVFARHPNLRPGEVRDRLMNSVKPLNDLHGQLAAPGIVSAIEAIR